MVRRPTLRAMVVIAAFTLVVGQMPPIARAAATTFIVTVTTDDPGASCVDPCSLRQAINAANANAGADTIEFEIPAALVSGAHTISPTSPLPTITEGVTIDATTDADFVSCGDGPILAIDGIGAGPGANGLSITSGSSTIKGLAISRFSGPGIRLTTGGGNAVTCNYLGTDVTGTLARGNQYGIVLFNSASNTIGGGNPGEGNLISGNSPIGGITINDVGSTGNVVQGNLIGTAADGVSPLGNAFMGVRISSGASSNTIGGTAAGAVNVIAFNGGAGVSIGAGNGNSVLGNSITGSTDLAQANARGLGIDLQEDGITANDAGDVDSSGPNRLQNYPVITAATSSSIDGTLDATPGTYRLEFFKNASCDTLGNGEGTVFLGALTAQPTGLFSFPTALGVGDVVTATATKDATGDTSEFSACATVADAPSLVVNVTGDTVDASGCTVLHCSLREAINRSNASVGVDIITFDIPGAGPHTISPTSALPIVSDAAYIDATTEPGSSCTTGLKIELDGTAVASGHGLHLTGSGTTVKGFVINRFTGVTSSGVYMGGSGSHVVACNLIGTDVSGTVDLGNGFAGVEIPAGSNGNTAGGAAVGDGNLVSGNRFGLRVIGDTNTLVGNRIGTSADGSADVGNAQQGILVQGVGNVVGGSSTGEANTISGNDGFGVQICCGSSSGNVVQGNLIGTDAAGVAALPNDSGISLGGGTHDNIIGGSGTGEGNLVSGNAFHGIAVSASGTTGNVIVGNRIGTAFDGVSPLGNQRHGVYFDDGATGNLVGGTSTGDANLIAFNGNDGVAVGRPSASVVTTGIRIVGNMIHSNAEQGIDLGGDGVTANDSDDADLGANDLQNFPVPTSAAGTSVSGTLDAAAATIFRVEVFLDSACDTGGFGEGEAAIGAANVTTNAAGDASFSISVNALSAGQIVTAAATDPAGNTSEFSACLTATASTGRIVVRKDAQPNSEQDFTFTAGGGLSPSSFVLDDNGTETDGLPSSRSFETLAPGSGYSVVEAGVDAWTSSVSCDDGSPANNIDVAAGEIVTCTFVNEVVCVDGPVVLTPVPADIRLGMLESNECMFLFHERDLTIGPGGQPVDESPVIGGANPVLPQGSVVSSYLVHFDDATNGPTIPLTGIYTFPQPVLGVIFELDSLNNSDDDLGVPDYVDPPTTGLYYEKVSPNRDFETSDSYSIGLDGRTVTFNLQTQNALDNIRVVVGTLPPGRIVVVKDAVPDSEQDFTFTAGGGLSPSTFVLDDNGTETDALPSSRSFDTLAPGSGYSVVETSHDAWATSVTCSDGSPSTNISVSAGETVRCTFVNTPVCVAGPLVATPLPADIRVGNLQSDECMFLFTEQTRTIGAGGQPVDASPVIGGANPSLPAGSVVTSYIVHFDDATNTHALKSLTGVYTFPEPVLGVIHDPVSLDNSDAALGVPDPGNPATDLPTTGLYYEHGNADRGLEGIDTYTIGPDGKTVTFNLNTRDQGLDNIRVVVGTLPPGRIVVEKQTDPDGASQSFGFTASYDGDGFSLSDGQQDDSGPIAAGTYSVSELTPLGWDLLQATCNDGSAPSAIAVGYGETVTCTFTNQQDANIIIQKQTTPDGSGQPFDFTARYDGDGFSLSDGQQNDSGDLSPGTYSVSESLPTNWLQHSVTCSDGSLPGSIDLAAGETVTCVFDNRFTLPGGTIIVEKQTLPDGSSQSFDFTANYDTDGFSLTDGQQNVASVTSGTYSVTEGAVTGWDPTSASCTSNQLGSSTDPVSLNVRPGEVLTCMFANTQRGRIIIDKVTNPAGSTQPFSFNVTGGAAPGINITATGVTDASAPLPTPLLQPGTYSVTEGAVTGWLIESASCISNVVGNSTDPASLIVRPGEVLTCVFTNAQRGRIVIDKVTNPAGSTQPFPFNVSGPGTNINATRSDTQTPLPTPLLQPGTYAVTEGPVTGWDLTSATCTSNQSGNSTNPASLNVRPGEVLTCVFTNTQRGRIVIDKVTNPAGSTQSFPFRITGGPTPAVNLTIGLTDGSAPAPTPFLRPGTYAVTEGNVVDWQIESASCTSNQPGNTTNPASLTLRPGEVLTCTFTNRPIPITLSKTQFNVTANQSVFTAQLGDTIGYTLTVRKTGAGTTSPILVADLMLPRLRLENRGQCTLVSTTAAGTLLRCAFGSLSGSTDQSQSVEFTARVILDNGCTVVGTRDGDFLGDASTGVTNGPDVICGAGGADIVEALGGDDIIYGNQPLSPSPDLSPLTNRAWLNPNGDPNTAADPGEQTVSVTAPMGPSFDLLDDLSGGSGNDTIYGQEGGDFLRGDAGKDELHGQTGGDTILGGSGNDFLYGEEGNDSLEGQAGTDYLEGNDGADEMWGGDQFLAINDGSDVLLGGAGRDRMAGDNGKQPTSGGSPDFMNGGADEDLMYGQGGSECSPTLSSHQECPVDRKFVILTFNRTDYVPQMEGGGSVDRLHGGSGDDRLDGGRQEGNALVGGDGDSDFCSRGPDNGDFRAVSCELRPPPGTRLIPWGGWNWEFFTVAWSP